MVTTRSRSPMTAGGRVAVGIVAVVLAAAAPLAASASPIKVGQPAPPFSLTTYDGQHVTLDQLKGQVVILNFWATWCGPCRKELPLLDSYQRLGAKYGLRTFAVATEDSVPPYQLKPLQTALAIPLVRRMHGPYADVGALPTNFIIDRSGIVRYAQAGAFELNDLNAVVIPLLNEHPPSAAAPPPPPAAQ